MTIDLNDLENRLWAAADQLWANTGLKPSEFSNPVLGLIFLRYAEKRFHEAEAKLIAGGLAANEIEKFDYQAEGALYLPETARFRASDYQESGTPVINVRNIGFGSIREDKLEFISDDTVRRLSSHLLRAEDIVFGRKGAVERHVYIQPGQENWFQGSDCLRLRLKSSRTIPRFASYYFLTHEHQQWIMSQCSHGATMASLNQDIISRIELPCPPISVQLRIASILSSYDDLIENNTRRIAILEEMARRIYEEWFVRFRFPGHEQVEMIESELGAIPESWKVGPLCDVVRLLSGFAFKTKDFLDEGDFSLVTIKNVQDGEFINQCTNRLATVPPKLPSHCHLSTGDVLLSLTGNIGRCCIVIGDRYLLNQRVAKLQPQREDDICYVYCLFRSHETRMVLESISNGVAQQNLSPVETERLPWILPTLELRESFAELTTPIWNLLITLQKKNRNLRATRDLLLPKLISGELDVSSLPELETEAA